MDYQIPSRALILSFVIFFLFSIAKGPAFSEEKGKGGKAQMPPSMVVVKPVKRGMIAPHNNFTGTVFFSELSDVSSEQSGRVDDVLFQEGQKVKAGQALVKMNSDILGKRLKETKASYEESLSELEKARLDLKRMKALYKEDSIAVQTYDDYRFRVLSLEKKASSLESSVERLDVEMEKKVVRAPFEGIVTGKSVDRGEWLAPGSRIATIARNGEYDIVVDVPEKVTRFIRKGKQVIIRTGGKSFKGKVLAIIPKGDISTRTFPIKIRLKTDASLMEGMQAEASLPVGRKDKVFIVPRDAVVAAFGQNAVFTVADSKALMIPIKLLGYKGLTAGISGDGLKEGMTVVVKGNERLRNGQPVMVIQGKSEKKGPKKL